MPDAIGRMTWVIAVSLGTDYARAIQSDVPIVCQHTRLDPRQAENALLSTVA